LKGDVVGRHLKGSFRAVHRGKRALVGRDQSVGVSDGERGRGRDASRESESCDSSGGRGGGEGGKKRVLSSLKRGKGKVIADS